MEAAKYAEQTSGDLWEFAVEIQQLRKLGLSLNDLRMLVRLRYVDHASEVTALGDRSRQFRPTGDLYFTRRTCFVLTPVGIAAATGRCEGPTEHLQIPFKVLFREDSVRDRPLQLPNWDHARRVLSFKGQIVKQFKWRAANQEMILTAFQEDGWPTRIDDPLGPLPALVTKRRLNDAIKCLNRNQTNELIRFRGDGTGQGIIWELVNSSKNELDVPDRVN